MAGSLLEKARSDWNELTSSGGFEVTFTFVAPTGETIDVSGIYSKTTLATEFETGAFANYQKVFASVSYSQFDNSDYPLRNDDGIVSLVDHVINFVDASGEVVNYRCSQVFPNDTVGVFSFEFQRYD